MNFWYKNRSLSRNKIFPQVFVFSAITSWVRRFDSSCRACSRARGARLPYLASGGVLALQCLFIDEIAIYCFLIDAVSLIRFRVDVWVFGLAGPDASCANSRRRYSMTTAGGRKERAGARARARAKERVMESPMERGLLLNFSLKRNNLIRGSLVFPIKLLTKRERTRERARKKDREGGRPKQTGLYEYTYCVYNVLSRARPRPLAEDTLRLRISRSSQSPKT